MDIILGKCSICGGRVTVPEIYWSTVPPTPKCKKCGAVATQNYGPVIPMTPRVECGGITDTAWADPSDPKNF